MHTDQPLVIDSDDADILKFVSGCKVLFLDVGSNRGTLICILFEPYSVDQDVSAFKVAP